MEKNSFFLWVSRLTTLMFLIFLITAVGFSVYGFFQSRKWSNENVVELVGNKKQGDKVEELKLGDISEICGKDIQYVELMSKSEAGSLSSYGYDRATRNIVFFIGDNMDSHWLFESNEYHIEKIDQLKIKADDCKEREAKAIYYEVVKVDTNKDDKLNSDDDIILAITNPDGKNYTELDKNIKKIVDHKIDHDAKVLTVLMQKGNDIIMKKFDIETRKQIAERQIAGISKSQ